jgi:hypothetical protein
VLPIGQQLASIHIDWSAARGALPRASMPRQKIRTSRR